MNNKIIVALGLLLGSTSVLAAGQHDGMAHSHASAASKVNNHADHSQMDHGNMQHHGEMASAVGMPAPASQASQTYHVTLTDDMKMTFTPALSIKQGEVVRFMVSNKGQLPHEFSIGSIDEQNKHRELMRAMPDMKHDDGTTLSLAPGESAEMGWHFMGLNFVEFSCNVPGHSEAGMKRNTILR